MTTTANLHVAKGIPTKRKGVRREFYAPSAIAAIQRKLLRWGRHNFQEYPWRSERDPWRTFLAEFLLQRTRANQVAAVFAEITTAFPTVDGLLREPPGVVAAITSRLGLHFRASQLVEIAARVARNGGTIPESDAELRAFAGVGAYTSAAWRSLHRGQRATIVDANVARWLSRMTGMPAVSDPRRVRWVRDLAEQLTPARAYRAYNYAVLDFTMMVCRPRKPVCVTCPLRAQCNHARIAIP